MRLRSHPAVNLSVIYYLLLQLTVYVIKYPQQLFLAGSNVYILLLLEICAQTLHL